MTIPPGSDAIAHPPRPWRIKGGEIALDPPLVMGILNITPDSFSDGGEVADLDGALRRAEELIEQGAAILDVGGESTRPGAAPVDEYEELRRVLPVVEGLARRFSVPISIDTRKAVVARAALDAGAAILNDVSALAFDPAMADTAAERGAGVVLMHSRGTPAEMRSLARYEDGVEVEVVRELEGSIARAIGAGISRDSIVLDPGIGFAKTGEQSLRMLAHLELLASLGFPLLVGPSRKSFLGELLDLPPRERVVGSAVACAMAYLKGARIFRVHDAAAASQALRLVRAIERARFVEAGVSHSSSLEEGGRE